MFFVPNRRPVYAPYSSTPQPSYMQSSMMDSLMDSYQSTRSLPHGIQVVDPEGDEWLEKNSSHHLQDSFQSRSSVPSMITIHPDMSRDEDDPPSPGKVKPQNPRRQRKFSEEEESIIGEGETLILSEGKVLPQIPSRLASQEPPPDQDSGDDETVEVVPPPKTFKNNQLENHLRLHLPVETVEEKIPDPDSITQSPVKSSDWHEAIQRHPLGRTDPTLQKLYRILSKSKPEVWTPFIFQPCLTYKDTGFQLQGTRFVGNFRHHLRVPQLRLYPFGMDDSGDLELSGKISGLQIDQVQIGKDDYGSYLILPDLEFGNYKIEIDLK